MNQSEALVDGIDFGTVADYLKNPASQIQFLLHVRDRSMLPELADALTREHESGGFAPDQTPRRISEMFARGELLYSAREGADRNHDSRHIDAKEIDREAFSQVIYMETFYLVHTAGLFEGQHRIGTARSDQRNEIRPNPAETRRQLAADWAELRRHSAHAINHRSTRARQGIGKRR